MRRQNNKIKRHLSTDYAASRRHHPTMKNKRSKTSTATSSTQNYYGPLQALDDDDIDFDADVVPAEKTAKTHIPPITILKSNNEQIHKFCKDNNINDFCTQKVSIGIKLFCKTKIDFNLACLKLSKDFEFFTHMSKNEKPYKALLFGLDKCDPMVIKNLLISKGLKCNDVKLVQKTSAYNVINYIYVVYFDKQSITINELREKHYVIDYVKVRWERQRVTSSRITQCYNCQLYGHGASKCKVKTFCAICAENHKTSDCKASTIKCANCGGTHKASSNECPSRVKFIEIRNRYQHANRRVPVRPGHGSAAHNHAPAAANYNSNFPNMLNQGNVNGNNSWFPRPPLSGPTLNSNNNNLFTLEEIKNLTLELIVNLKKCKDKSEQFEVITTLACKFLS